MNIRTDRNGFTLLEAVAIICVLTILATALWPAMTSAMDNARATEMKNKGRRIWAAILAANYERAPLGLSPVWPQEMGFTGTNTSTAYFRSLLIKTNVVGMGFLDGYVEKKQLALALTLDDLSGIGVPVAKSADEFTSANNAWCVTCINSNTPAATPFLFLRNLNAENILSSTSRMSLASSKTPIHFFDRTVFITRSGVCSELRNYWIGRIECGENPNYFCPTNCPPVAVMRP